ncbi:MAG: phage tail sheath family protein [Cytophagaceae bacterium]
MAQNLATPGVYIEEKSAFGNSVAGIPTAVPAFIGYTEKTVKGGQSLINKPVRITSLAEFHSTFGTGFQSSFRIQQGTNTTGGYDFEVDGKPYTVVPDNSSRFIFYDSIRLFFANGGSTCYITTVGAYTTAEGGENKAAKDDKSAKDEKGAKDNKVAVPERTAGSPEGAGGKVNQITKKALEAGLNALIMEDEPTIVVIPEAVMLAEADCFALQQAMLMHCGFKMRSRVALLDVYNGSSARTYDNTDIITRFREGVGSNFLAYGAAYYPYVYTSIVQGDELNFNSISNLDLLEELLNKEAELTSDTPKKADEIKNEVKKLRQSGVNVESLTQTLQVVSPTFKKALTQINRQLNILPPSGGIAGIISMVDATRGVWKAPANVSYATVVSPVVKLTHEDQEDLNVTVTGKSVNAIRSFVGEGTKVWGARTLDGNSKDWRYINVRRTLIYIEQSVKYAAKPYVYEPNTAATWVLMKSMINAFLNDLWRAGGLVGLTPADAFEVQVGLGSTMTPNDILDGIMRISVKVAISRPAEFIVITFEQKMQQS